MLMFHNQYLHIKHLQTIENEASSEYSAFVLHCNKFYAPCLRNMGDASICLIWGKEIKLFKECIKHFEYNAPFDVYSKF